MDDANELIDLARESGLIEAQFQKYVPHATECLSHADVEQSHLGKDQTVVFKINNIHGMIILLAIGLGGASFTAMAEIIVYKACKKKDEPTKVIVL